VCVRVLALGAGGRCAGILTEWPESTPYVARRLGSSSGEHGSLLHSCAQIDVWELTGSFTGVRSVSGGSEPSR